MQHCLSLDSLQGVLGKEGQGQEARASCRQCQCLANFWTAHNDHCTIEASQHVIVVKRVQGEFDRVKR